MELGGSLGLDAAKRERRGKLRGNAKARVWLDQRAGLNLQVRLA